MIGQKGVPARSGGIEQHVDILSRELVTRGHEVIAYCRRSYCGRDERSDTIAGVRRIFRPSIPTTHLDAITHTFLSTIDVALRRADVVHYHAIGPGGLAPLARLAGLPVVVTVHGLDWQRAKWGGFATKYLQISERLAATGASRLLVVSPTLYDHFQDLYGVRAEFIPNGVIPFPYRQPSRILRWGIEPRRFLFTAARFVPEKGLHYLIEAFGRTNWDLKLVIAGDGGFDSRYDHKLRAMADNRVIFTGPADRELMAEFYSHALMYMLPSDLEGMSIALLEAMCAGLPVLVSDIPQNTCVVEDAGFTFRAGDVDHLKEVLDKALSQPERLSEWGRLAREKTDKFQWSTVVEQLERVYAECTGTRIDETSDRTDLGRKEPAGEAELAASGAATSDAATPLDTRS